MAHSIKAEGSSILIELTGSVDLSTTPVLKQEYESLMSSDVNKVFVNAGGLDYIDSSGVATLLFLRKTCARYNSKLVFHSISDSAFRVIELANLDKILDVGKCIASGSIVNEKEYGHGKVHEEFSIDNALSLFK